MKITAEKLQKYYLIDHSVEIKALRDINLEIPSGSSVAIVGPSGAGQSTLLHLLGLMDRPTSGRITMDGADVSSLDDREHARLRRESIGFLFQMHYLLPDFTVWENILLPVWDRRHEKSGTARELLESLGLFQRRDHMPSEISGGEQQRAALARALINDPDLLLADEPTGNLDRETGSKVEEFIFSECRKRDVTLILVTHNPELAAKADRIVTMRDGCLVS